MRVQPIDKTKLASTAEEFRDLVASDADWIVRDNDDLQQLRDADSGPLANLPLADFRAFSAGLRFNRNGVTTGTYRPLMAALTISEIFEVFEGFGMDRGLALTTLEEACVNGKCQFSFWSFCSHLNCP